MLQCHHYSTPVSSVCYYYLMRNFQMPVSLLKVADTNWLKKWWCTTGSVSNIKQDRQPSIRIPQIIVIKKVCLNIYQVNPNASYYNKVNTYLAIRVSSNISCVS